MSLVKIRDGITPDLRRKAKAMKNPNRALDAMGRAVISLGERAFTDSVLRPTAWAPRKDDEPHPLLQKSTTLRKSLHHKKIQGKMVIIGSPTKYAAIHQLGGKTGRRGATKIPARPYLPFLNGKLTDRGDVAVARALRAAIKADLGA